jgi:hypothetical protein
MLAKLLQENSEFVQDVEEGLVAKLNNLDFFFRFFRW